MLCQTKKCRCINCKNSESNPDLHKIRIKLAESDALLQNLSWEGEIAASSDTHLQRSQSLSCTDAPAPNVSMIDDQDRSNQELNRDASLSPSSNLDPLLPPSAYTLPMTIKDAQGADILVAALAFGIAREKRISDTGKADGNVDRNRTPSKIEVVCKHEDLTVKEVVKPGSDASRPLKRLRETFDDIREEILKESCGVNSLNPFEGEQIRKCGNNAPSLGSRLFQSVKKDLSNLIMRVNHAEIFTMQMMRGKHSIDQSRHVTEAEVQLECNEKLEPLSVEHEISPVKSMELLLNGDKIATDLSLESTNTEGKSEGEESELGTFFECAEDLDLECRGKLAAGSLDETALSLSRDVAMIRELTQIIRRKTLDLTRQRTGLET